MTAKFTKPAARRATVALTRKDVANILTFMGWEPEDVTVFWWNTRRETRNPGILEREMREELQRAFPPEDS